MINKFPDWQPIETAPRDGTLMEVRFDPSTAEIDGSGKNLAEFYAPGSTRKRQPTPPVISNVKFKNGHFRPVVSPGPDEIDLYAILSVTLTHWRPQTTTARKHPIDIIDGVLRPLLGSLPGTEAAVSTWIALRREGYLMDAPEADIDDR